MRRILTVGAARAGIHDESSASVLSAHEPPTAAVVCVLVGVAIVAARVLHAVGG